ncbi:MAG: hypothetical protein KatS3mg085_352 [Candidatus Dojkabacteria bacterium]|nr:MAG: hypothetical protein KatS3mg085_352 [Candidatus Dojkabacteria bacterium]
MKKSFQIGLWFLILLLLISSTFFSLYLSLESKGELTFIDKEPVSGVFTKEVVYVSGAVMNPGIYEINANQRVWDIIQLAGGFSDEYDISYVNEQLNLAQKVNDGMHIYIPFKNSENLEQTINKVSINSSSLSELVALDGVGESTAQKIIENRPYSSINDLMKVPGIGEATLNKLKPFITL